MYIVTSKNVMCSTDRHRHRSAACFSLADNVATTEPACS